MHRLVARVIRTDWPHGRLTAAYEGRGISGWTCFAGRSWDHRIARG